MQSSPEQVDRVFRALSDPTRRAVVARLTAGPAPVGELAKPFAMALPSFLQHLAVLEESGIVRTKKSGRVRHCRLVPASLAKAENWLGAQRTMWERRLDQLDNYLTELKEQR